jgi:putative transposase
LKFGQQHANQLRRKRAYIADKWHLDEVVLTIKGQQYYLWRAVDAAGNVLDVCCNDIGTRWRQSVFFANC